MPWVNLATGEPVPMATLSLPDMMVKTTSADGTVGEMDLAIINDLVAFMNYESAFVQKEVFNGIIDDDLLTRIREKWFVMAGVLLSVLKIEKTSVTFTQVGDLMNRYYRFDHIDSLCDFLQQNVNSFGAITVMRKGETTPTSAAAMAA
jgi:hypothetical protein